MENEIEKSYHVIKKNLLENEGLDVKERMLEERRKYIIKYFEDSLGKELPSNINEFYNQEDKENKSDKKKNKGKKTTKKNKSKKLTEEELFLFRRDAIGPESSEELKNLKELIEKYSREWGN